MGWRAHNICAHCIAEAEDNNELQEFLTWFTASKGKKSNLTDAIYHGTYKHAGLKKPPRRRYGDTIHLPTEQKTDRLALSDISNLGKSDTACAQLPADQSKCVGQGNLKNTQSQSTIASSAMQPSETLCLTMPGQDNPQNIPATVTAHSRVNDNSGNLGKSIQVCSMAQNVGTIKISPSSLPSVSTACTNTSVVSLLSQITLPSYQSSSRTMTSCATQNSIQSLLQSLATPGATTAISQVSLPSLLQSLTTPGRVVTSNTSQILLPSLLQSLTSLGSPAASNMSTRVNSMKPATLKSDQPFFLSLLTNRIKKCAGCSTLFHDGSEQTPAYILGHSERDWYPQDDKWNLGKLQNKYYHLKRSCVCSRCPLYEFPKDLYTLQIHLVPMIPPSVKQILNKEFGVDV